jgi:hypothetical protein
MTLADAAAQPATSWSKRRALRADAAEMGDDYERTIIIFILL